MFDWITGLLDQFGYFGVGFLMFAENVFPPIPSELIMPLAGFLTYEGNLNFFAVLVAGSIGSLLGTGLWYLGARKIGRRRVREFIARHGRWLTITLEDLDRASDWFERHGRGAVLIGRMVPGIRTVISVPAGLTGMAVTPFLVYSLIGTLIWNLLLTGLGYALGSQYDLVQTYLNPVSNIIFAAIALLYVYRLVRGKGKTPREP
ncbi:MULTISPECIES: DedA family protein [unclassified Sulfitobacter]|uniref:DedA family protein n=1 Tax=unclassified Sulfitobacter TaxID=196795 RepID=UPI0007C343D2|nr:MULTISPECIES: DedA family protein [unclassified Sulfitobacter]KZY02195.1 alkaline phosphatase [Sulfitobacter sp. HI0023]KZY25793.1 alkaline phosphatase [Sulfitobacter sp. HI0040]KZZ62748.1 alkaline phosphatase [Sulfitobacter sp. HI0129]